MGPQQTTGSRILLDRTIAVPSHNQASSIATKLRHRYRFILLKMDDESRAMHEGLELALRQTVIEHPGENDVLFGRGAPFMRWKGNVKFREFVNTRKAEYLSTRRHADKNIIARQIIDFIRHERNGRFLMKADTTGSSWIEANDSVILEKVKQTLRDKQTGRYRQAEPPTGDSGVPKLPSRRPQPQVSLHDCSQTQALLRDDHQGSIHSISTSQTSDHAGQEAAISLDSFSERDGLRHLTIPRRHETTRSRSDSVQQTQASTTTTLDGVVAQYLSHPDTQGIQQRLHSLHRDYLQQLQLLYETEIRNGNNRLGQYNYFALNEDRQALPAEVYLSQILESLSRPQIQASVPAFPMWNVQLPQGLNLIDRRPPQSSHESLQDNPLLTRGPTTGVLGGRQDLVSPLIASLTSQGAVWPGSFNMARPHNDGNHVVAGFPNSSLFMRTSSATPLGSGPAPGFTLPNRALQSLDRLQQSIAMSPHLLRLLSTTRQCDFPSGQTTTETNQVHDAGVLITKRREE